MSHSNKCGSCFSLFRSRDDQFSTNGDGRGVVGPNKTNLLSQKVYLGTYRNDGGLGHLRVIIYYLPCIHNVLGVINLTIWVVLRFLLHLVMVKVVWVLVPPTPPTRKFIFGLTVDTFCCIRVVIVCP